jgi:hypothetical protein
MSWPLWASAAQAWWLASNVTASVWLILVKTVRLELIKLLILSTYLYIDGPACILHDVTLVQQIWFIHGGFLAATKPPGLRQRHLLDVLVWSAHKNFTNVSGG